MESLTKIYQQEDSPPNVLNRGLNIENKYEMADKKKCLHRTGTRRGLGNQDGTVAQVIFKSSQCNSWRGLGHMLLTWLGFMSICVR